jgi:hypothetical protein
MTCFWGAVNRNNFLCRILLFTSLNVSASRGHPQVKFTQPFLVAITRLTEPAKQVINNHKYKIRQSRYLTRNYLFYVQILHTSLYSQHVSAAMRHHQLRVR